MKLTKSSNKNSVNNTLSVIEDGKFALVGSYEMQEERTIVMKNLLKDKVMVITGAGGGIV